MYLVDENGNKILLKEVEQINCSTQLLLFKVSYHIREADKIRLQESLSRQTGYRCIVVDSSIDKIYGLG